MRKGLALVGSTHSSEAAEGNPVVTHNAEKGTRARDVTPRLGHCREPSRKKVPFFSSLMAFVAKFADFYSIFQVNTSMTNHSVLQLKRLSLGCGNFAKNLRLWYSRNGPFFRQGLFHLESLGSKLISFD